MQGVEILAVTLEHTLHRLAHSHNEIQKNSVIRSCHFFYGLMVNDQWVKLGAMGNLMFP